MNTVKPLYYLFVLLLVGSLSGNFSTSAYAQTYQPTWASLDSRPTPDWFADAKFGIFVHWGVYSVPSWAPVGQKDVPFWAQYAEWYWYRTAIPADSISEHAPFIQYHQQRYGDDVQYQDFAPQFTAEMYQPDEWADLFKQAGARYVVLTSKHHEGFCLWPSAYSWNWNSQTIGAHRDLAGDLSKAVKEAGLKMGFYYSLYEWFNPLYQNQIERYVDSHMLPQMKELVTTYEPDILWSDGEWEQADTTWRSQEFLTWLFNESSVKDKIAVNDRWGKDSRLRHGGYYTTEYDELAGGNASVLDSHVWEECRGIGTSFGYNRNENLEDYASSEELVHKLIGTVAQGGNLLLNVGPTADGRIPVIMQQRLLDIGAWLATNGQAIYGSRKWQEASQAATDSTIHYTQKGKDLYVIGTQYPEKGKRIQIKGIGQPTSAQMLGVEDKVVYQTKANTLSLQLPDLSADQASPYAWVVKLEGAL